MAVVPAIVADAASVGTDASCVGHELSGPTPNFAKGMVIGRKCHPHLPPFPQSFGNDSCQTSFFNGYAWPVAIQILSWKT